MSLRGWLLLALAYVLVLAIVALVIFFMGRGTRTV